MRKFFFALIFIFLSTNALAKRTKKQQGFPTVPVCREYYGISGDFFDALLGVYDWDYMPFTPKNNSKYSRFVYFWEGLVRVNFNSKGAPYVTVLKSRKGKWLPQTIEHVVPEAQKVGGNTWHYFIPQTTRRGWCIGYIYVQVNRDSGRVSLHRQVLPHSSASFVLYPREQDFLKQVYIFDLDQSASCEGKGCKIYGLAMLAKVTVGFWLRDVTGLFRELFGLTKPQ